MIPQNPTKEIKGPRYARALDLPDSLRHDIIRVQGKSLTIINSQWFCWSRAIVCQVSIEFCWFCWCLGPLAWPGGSSGHIMMLLVLFFLRVFFAFFISFVLADFDSS